VALGTGGARGIGRGIALRLAADSHAVAVADLPSMRDETEGVAAEIDGVALGVDVSDAGQVDAMIAATVSALASFTRSSIRARRTWWTASAP
jgi:meso-butanediol dehydrogenase / (S,S)-butanediol dehydrogenase / diacetyl reductase